jgi:hypothetical protein
MVTKTLLDDLAERRTNHVHLKRAAPYIGLTRTGRDAQRVTAQLLDVGSDFITIGLEAGRNRNEQIIARSQIAEILWLGEGN